MNDLGSVLFQIGTPRMLVVGDAMLDRYVWGEADRVSPEAPVLVLRADRSEIRLGGAAAVAALLRGLQARVSLAGVIGDDASGHSVARLLAEDQIDDLTCCDSSRPTTTKERIIGRTGNKSAAGGHQIVRVDHEVRDPIGPELERRLIASVIDQLADCQALLISDYGKGVCTPEFMRQIIAAANDRGIPVLVDPAAGGDCTRYSGATLLVPNRREAELASGLKVMTPDQAIEAGRILRERTGAYAVLVKLDREGIAVVGGEYQKVIPARARDVYDVTGAGDMVLAMLGLCLASGLDVEKAAQLANVAAGMEVERVGVVPISRSEIQSELVRQTSHAPKLVTADEMSILAERYRRERRSVVFTNGCFDLLHMGHVGYLTEAACEGDVLVVAVNSDASVRQLKGATRPIVAQDHRAALLSALACVDHVLIFDTDSPCELLQRLRPDVLVKGGTYRVDEVVGREIVEAYGGRVCVTGVVEGMSTTGILRQAALQTGAGA